MKKQRSWQSIVEAHLKKHFPTPQVSDPRIASGIEILEKLGFYWGGMQWHNRTGDEVTRLRQDIGAWRSEYDEKIEHLQRQIDTLTFVEPPPKTTKKKRK